MLLFEVMLMFEVVVMWCGCWDWDARDVRRASARVRFRVLVCCWNCCWNSLVVWCLMLLMCECLM